MKDFPFADDSCLRMVGGKLQDDPLFGQQLSSVFVVLFQLNQSIDSEIFPGFSIATCHASDAGGTSLHRVSNLWIRDVFLVDSG